MKTKIEKPSRFKGVYDVSTKILEDHPINFLGKAIQILAFIIFIAAIVGWSISWGNINDNVLEVGKEYIGGAFAFVITHLALLLVLAIFLVIAFKVGYSIKLLACSEHKVAQALSMLVKGIAQFYFAFGMIMAPVSALAIWTKAWIYHPYYKAVFPGIEILHQITRAVGLTGEGKKFILGLLCLIFYFVAAYLTFVIWSFVSEIIMVVFGIGNDLSNVRKMMGSNGTDSSEIETKPKE